MAYVAARGGEEAIQHAERFFRALNGPLNKAVIQTIEQHMPYLIDRVMGEGSLYAPQLAALALAQSGGDIAEAVLLLRAYRSTLPRLAYALPVTEAELLTVRRVSAAFKDIPGGQVLGPTLDYSHRLLHTEALDNPAPAPPQEPAQAETPASRTYPSVADWHRLNGLLDGLPEQPPVEPTDQPDITREPLNFPAPRAQRLQALARAETGGVLTLGYASMRGYGMVHPTVNEVRLSYADVCLRHPITGVTFSAGRVRVTQTDVVNTTADHMEMGFAATMGWNEIKTIAGAMLDMEMNNTESHPAHNEEFVLSHTEPVEAAGFCVHYKLPHYVTFSSSLDTIRRVRAHQQEQANPSPDTAPAHTSNEEHDQ